MSPAISLSALAVICVAAVALGLRFRTHPTWFYVSWYRSPALPAIVRNIPILMPYWAALLVPPLVLVLPAAYGSQIGMGWPLAYQKALAFGAMGYFLLVMGTTGVLLNRPPQRVVPRWLRLDDDRVGFRRPPLDLFDAGTIVVSAVFVLGGVASLVIALWFVVTGHGPDGK